MSSSSDDVTMEAVMHALVRDYFRSRGLSKSLDMFDTAMQSKTGQAQPLDLDSLFNQRVAESGRINANTLDRLVEKLMTEGLVATKLKPPRKKKKNGSSSAASGGAEDDDDEEDGEDDGWSETEVKKLKKACKKYPSGKTSEEDAQRWEKVAKALGSDTRTAADCKAKYRALKKKKSGSSSSSSAGRGGGKKGRAKGSSSSSSTSSHLMNTGPVDRESALQDLVDDDEEDDGIGGAEEIVIVADDSDSEGSGDGRHRSSKKAPKKEASSSSSSSPSGRKKVIRGGFGLEREIEPADAAGSPASSPSAAASSPVSSSRDNKDDDKDKGKSKDKSSKKKDKKKKKKHHSSSSSSSSSKKHSNNKGDDDDVEASTGGFFGGGAAGDVANHHDAAGGVEDGVGELDEFDLSGDEELENLDNVVVGSRGAIVGGGGGGLGGATLSTKDRKKLHQIVFGETVPFKSKKYFNSAWLRQGFSFSEHEDLKYGLIQNEGGPCGPLACVQAHVLLHFMTAHGLAGDDISKHVTAAMQQEAITAALTTILWRAACQRKGGEATASAVVALPEDPKSRGDPLVEGMELHSFRSRDALASFLASKAARRAYCSLKGPGIALFVCSVALSRGLDAIHDDFDTAQGLGESAFLTSHFYASQLLVNLCLVGRAVPNIFDGEQTADEFLLRGIPSRSDIGFLTLYEHHDYVRAGSHYKLPRLPIWVVCSESHYSTFFAAASDAKPLTQQLSGSFDLLYFDGLDGQDERICLSVSCDGEGHNVELEKEGGDPALVPPLNHCVRTCWPKSSIHWNGSEPRL